MSLRSVLQKFAEGFSVTGIYLQTPQELFPIVQQRADSLLALKRHRNLPIGITELKIQDTKMGVLVDSLDTDVNIIILAATKHIQEISATWKRFLPVIRKKIQIEEFILQESIETKLVNQLEDIRIAITDATMILKEKINFES